MNEILSIWALNNFNYSITTITITITSTYFKCKLILYNVKSIDPVWKYNLCIISRFCRICQCMCTLNDFAFIQLYNKTGMELCVVVTNLTNMEEEYFHPKTTPDVALRLAIRMSISIPGKKISFWKIVNI